MVCASQPSFLGGDRAGPCGGSWEPTRSTWPESLPSWLWPNPAPTITDVCRGGRVMGNEPGDRTYLSTLFLPLKKKK